jgi:hypothetical protein
VRYGLHEAALLGLLKDMRRKGGKDLVTIDEVCRAGDFDKGEVEEVARALEVRGYITCSPPSGQVAVLTLPEEDPVLEPKPRDPT